MNSHPVPESAEAVDHQTSVRAEISREMVRLYKEQFGRLRDTRLYFQHATKDEFIGTIERILNRKVRASNSSIDTHNDVAVEVFHLEPLTA